MVTLLVLSYKSYKQLPTKLSDFYDALFQTLIQRHDGTKPGFTRIRSCSLDDAQYRQVFEALCILAKKAAKQSFDQESIYSLSQEAIQHCELNASPSCYIDDIVKITCLILRDGEEYRFIHKTVQEYYTSSYIRRKPESWAVDFYTRVLKGPFFQWEQELEFLSEIDKYRYNKWFYLPAILKYLSLTESDLNLLKKDNKIPEISFFISNWVVGFNEKDFELRSFSVGGYLNNWVLTMFSIYNLFNILEKTLKWSGNKINKLSSYKVSTEDGIASLCVIDLIKLGTAKELLIYIAQQSEKIINNAWNIMQSTKDEENSSFLDGLV
jgi:hypothetical protein